MNLNDVFRLSRLRGWDMVDQAAVVVAGGAKGTPSKIARPLQSLLPDALQPLQGKWKEAADRVDDHIGALNGQVTVIRANWDTPDSFLPYMNNMTAVLGKQQKAMQDMDGAVTQLAATLKQYKQDAADANETLHEAFWNALIWGSAALVVAIAAEYAAATFTAGATAWSAAGSSRPSSRRSRARSPVSSAHGCRTSTTRRSSCGTNSMASRGNCRPFRRRRTANT